MGLYAITCGFLHHVIGTIRKAQEQFLVIVVVLFCCVNNFWKKYRGGATNRISEVSVRAKRGRNLHALTIFTGRR